MEATSGEVVVLEFEGVASPNFPSRVTINSIVYVVIRWAGAFSEFEDILGPTVHPSGPTLESSQDFHGGSTVRVCMCVFVCCHPIYLDVRLVDAPAGVTQEKGHIGFLHLPSGVLSREKDSVVAFPCDREVEFCVPTN